MRQSPERKKAPELPEPSVLRIPCGGSVRAPLALSTATAAATFRTMPFAPFSRDLVGIFDGRLCGSEAEPPDTSARSGGHDQEA